VQIVVTIVKMHSVIAVGAIAGFSYQGNSATAIGYEAGYSRQAGDAVAIGSSTGYVTHRFTIHCDW